MRIRAFAPPLLWTLLVTFLSLIHSDRLPSGGWLERLPIDKLVHVLLYAVMFFLYHRALLMNRRKGLNVMLLSSIITVFWGIVIEMLQWRMQLGRYFDMLDIIANITGVLISAVLVRQRSQ
jgi:VanZ family protein